MQLLGYDVCILCICVYLCYILQCSGFQPNVLLRTSRDQGQRQNSCCVLGLIQACYGPHRQPNLEIIVMEEQQLHYKLFFN